MWNPLPKMGRYGIHCPKRVFMESTAQNGSMWNPLPKLGLMLFTLEDTPNLALLKLEFERQAMGSVNIHFASNLFCWGRLVSILEKKDYTWKMVKCRTESTAQIGSDTIYLEECQKNSFFTLWTQRVCEWQCWNFRIFFFTLFLHFTWILFWSFWKPKNCHFAFWPF